MTETDDLHLVSQLPVLGNSDMAALLGSFTDAYGFVTLLEKPVVVVQVQSMQAADLQPHVYIVPVLL